MTTENCLHEPGTARCDVLPQRLHGLDAVRSGALLLGIVLHSLLPFTDIVWMINDSERSIVALWVSGTIHLFRMVLFMLLAGYFGRMVTLRRGSGSYFRDRAKRILLPAVVFWPFTVIPLGLLAMYGASVRGLPAPMASEPTSPLMMFTPGQLWFLLVLFEIATLVLLARAVLLRFLGAERVGRAAARIGDILSHPAGVLFPALVFVAALLLQGGEPAGGIIAPTTIVPEAASTLGYLGAFVTGWFLHASPGSMRRIARNWLPMLALGLIATVVVWFPGMTREAVMVAVALAGWLLGFGLLGAAVRFLNREHTWIRYLADASYWMYLVHLPLLVLFEIPLADLGWPILVKLLLTWAVTTAVLLTTYELLVRHTWLGAWLNGRRYPRRLR
ncbi:acyltransferase family protein [Arachnia propionica]|uniref:acyltransferase family protein n=1 Tax=Arachnia propionica TaxID=1750 RepID=UPI0030CEC5BC